MPSLRSTHLRIGILIALVLLIGASTYAYAAGNSVAGSNSGDGAGAVAGYVITNIRYTLNISAPTTIDEVRFSISPATASVAVQLTPTGSWHPCTNSAGLVACATAGETVLAAASLHVVAAQ